jgi:pimeloyl-ACP methyl ester carboxylesterase
MRTSYHTQFSRNVDKFVLWQVKNTPSKSNTCIKMKLVITIGAILTSTCLTSYSQMRFITIDSTKIRINTIGLENRKEGQPVIVFESGMGTPMGNWDRVLKGVAELAPLVTYDRPGIGESEPDHEMPTIKNVADKLIKILTHLHLNPPYVLVGHSLGGAYVRGFAVYHPEMLAGLVIIDPADFTENHENKRQYFIDIGIENSTIDSLFKKWDLESIANKGNSQAPMSVKEEGDVLENMRKTDFKEIADSKLPDIPVHILTGGRYDTPLQYRAKEFNDSLLFRAKMKHRVERWTGVIQSVDQGMLFYSGDAGHFVHYDDPELLISSVRIVLQDYELIRKKHIK